MNRRVAFDKDTVPEARLERLQKYIDREKLMTKAEQRMLYIHLRDPSSTEYHVPFRYEFGEGFDLHGRLRRLIERTPILRTRFVDGEAVCDVEVGIDEAEIDMWAPFDLVKGPLCRFGVQGRVLTGCIHHAICDGRRACSGS